jgi:peptidoglycan/LPS O-acetylase OafA/YrhL
VFSWCVLVEVILALLISPVLYFLIERERNKTRRALIYRWQKKQHNPQIIEGVS